MKDTGKFDHEKLEVFGIAQEFAALADDMAAKLPKGRGYLANQIRRASLSVVLNLAEGAGKYSPADKATFYLRARGSACECSAALDYMSRLGLAKAEQRDQARALLLSITRLLTSMVKTQEQRIKGVKRGGGFRAGVPEEEVWGRGERAEAEAEAEAEAGEVDNCAGGAT